MKKSDTPFLDRVILHNKNADERLFDMILRIITFIVLIIIVWIYADLTHAKADNLTLAQYYNIDFSKLNISNENSLLWRSDEYIYCLQNYTDITYNSNYHPPFQATGQATNVQLNDSFIMNDYYALYCITSSGLNGWYAYFIPKDLVDEGHVIWTRNGFYADNDFNFYAGSVWGNTVYPPTSFTFDSSSVHNLSVDQYSSSDLCYFSNMPIWSGTRLDSNVIGGAIDYNSIIEDAINSSFVQSNALFNCNYFLYDDILRNPWDIDDNVESNLNHLYLNDIQVGLSCNRINQRLESSNVIIGVDVDDWISNHMKSYNLKVDYDLYFDAQFNGVNSPLNGHYTTTSFNNLALFNNDAYSYGVSEIANESNFPLSSLNSQDIKVFSNSQPYYGLFPTILNYVQKEISNEWTVWTPSTDHNIVFNDFTLTVTCTLYSGLDYGGSYVKEFDFLTGAESVKRADILNNNNPWLGDPSPQLPANVPESGLINNNGGYGGGSTSVNVNVSGQKIPMNVQNQQEINNTLTNYTNAFETFSNSIRSLADTESQNNFYAVLSNTVPMIPGVNIFLQYVALTCGVMLILLVLKVLLF